MKVDTSGTETVIKPRDGTGEPTEYLVVRRRHGRRRRRELQADAPQQRFRLLLLVVVIVLMIAVVAGNSVRHTVSTSLRKATQIFPPDMVQNFSRPELVVLLLAAIILIYLMVPGLDKKVMRALGTGRRHRHR
jgi:uncharacterized BrkB/YihY/UPF0761 family membrane protein